MTPIGYSRRLARFGRELRGQAAGDDAAKRSSYLPVAAAKNPAAPVANRGNLPQAIAHELVDGKGVQMTRFAYRVHYDSNPRRAGHALLSEAQVATTLSWFRDDLRGDLTDDPKATVSSEPVSEDRNARFVVVETNLAEATVDAAVQMRAKNHDLQAVRVPQA
ncbi:hypothetical protein SBBP2_230028 [Burkholderiales bacterium]|nr:hypothetical protein SBBP2_230028 [Burkholderiales bacterium]